MCQRSARVHASTTSRSVCVGLRTAWSIMPASSGTVGSSTGRPVCSEDARLDTRRSPLRDRHSHSRFVDPDLLPRRLLPVGVRLPGSVPAVVTRKGLARLGCHCLALLCVSPRTRARAFARGATLPHVGLVDHTLPPRRGRESHARAALGKGRGLHGRGGGAPQVWHSGGWSCERARPSEAARARPPALGGPGG